MSNPVVHFEIVGAEPAKLRDYYSELFGWQYDVGDATTEAVSAPGEYGFVTNAGLNGGVCGGPDLTPKMLCYISVPDVEEALATAERLGGKRVMGPVRRDDFAVGHFTDPEGNLVGVAQLEGTE